MYVLNYIICNTSRQLYIGLSFSVFGSSSPLGLCEVSIWCNSCGFRVKLKILILFSRTTTILQREGVKRGGRGAKGEGEGEGREDGEEEK